MRHILWPQRFLPYTSGSALYKWRLEGKRHVHPIAAGQRAIKARGTATLAQIGHRLF